MNNKSKICSWAFGLFTAVLVICTCMLLTSCSAAGPWKGQVIDQKTKKPIEGAVLLMVWYYHAGIMDQARTYHDSEEAVTDGEGRFIIPSKTYWSLHVFAQRPDIYVFKSGYGQWQIQDYGQYTREKYDHVLERNAARLTGEGAVLEVSQLNTREEKIRQLRLPISVPRARIPKLHEAVNQESERLGLGRIYPN